MTKVQRKRQLVKRFLLLLKALNDCFGDGFVNAEYISLCNEYLARYGVRTADEFKEADHPQDKDGKFAKTKGNSDWGEAFTEFSNKPKEAIKHLLSVKRGYVPNAFYRDDIGRIDLVYGNRNFGLKHIEERRKQTG